MTPLRDSSMARRADSVPPVGMPCNTIATNASQSGLFSICRYWVLQTPPRMPAASAAPSPQLSANDPQVINHLCQTPDLILHMLGYQTAITDIISSCATGCLYRHSLLWDYGNFGYKSMIHHHFYNLYTGWLYHDMEMHHCDVVLDLCRWAGCGHSLMGWSANRHSIN